MGSEVLFADTNVFLRYLTNDVPEQADAVDSLLKAAENGLVTLVTTPLVVAEIVWTLESTYRVGRPGIAKMVLSLLNTPGLRIIEADVLLQAAVWYAERNVDFIDAYHAAWMHEQNLTLVATFDRKHFRRFEHLRVRMPGADPLS